jgi:DNA polymerase II large subunit
MVLSVNDHYFEEINKKTNEIYLIAQRVRSKGLDPASTVEVTLARDLAERVEGALKLSGLAKRIRELLGSINRVQAAFKIVEEIIYGKFGKFTDERAAELGLRTALAILTEGITAAPIEGIDSVKIKRNLDGTPYLAIYYAGPIRSAGGTEQGLTVVIGDYMRNLLKLDRYKPTNAEIERFIEELRAYERAVSRFQYHVNDDVLKYVLWRIPVEVTGIATDPLEVTGHKNLERIETNAVRGGALRVINDGVVGKANKIWKIVSQLGFEGWNWLREVKTNNEDQNVLGIKPNDKYMTDIIAGRPILSGPSQSGGFRLRYGRARNTGLAAVGIHPATMTILNETIAIGTQLRLERPGKSATVLPVDTIEPPIVKLKNGSVIVASTDTKYEDISQILFIGDILISFGDFLENNHPLIPAGYCEEWWAEELASTINEKFNGDVEKASSYTGIEIEKIIKYLKNPLREKPCALDALKISERLSIPLHPKYVYDWRKLNIDEVLMLRSWIMRALEKNSHVTDEVYLKLIPECKRILEKALIPHKIIDGWLYLGEEILILRKLLLDTEIENFSKLNDLFKILSIASGIKLRPKYTSFIGVRIGRPEKAKRRALKPPVQVLFPTGKITRDLIKIKEKYKKTFAELCVRKCNSCNYITYKSICPNCGQILRENLWKYCSKCNVVLNTNMEKCQFCGSSLTMYKGYIIDIDAEISKIMKKFGINIKCLRGVRKLSSLHKIPEPIEKGLLRSFYGLYVYKDGTIRFDATNAPLTHFKPKEIGTSINTLKMLGYEKDFLGADLRDEEQILELKIQDVILPKNSSEYLVRIANFIDDLLVKFYGLNPYYNVRRPEDLIGHLIIGIAPHTYSGVIGRIIGFTDANVCYAHPYWHAAKRRNCDGDEDSIILALDALINFSIYYLPNKKGRLMDSVYLLTTNINPVEVDDESHNIETHSRFGLEFYESSLKCLEPKDLLNIIDIVKNHLEKQSQYTCIKFLHDTASINNGPKVNMYKRLKNIKDKVKLQMELAHKILAVDVTEVATRLLSHHFLPDLMGNLKSFLTQKVRCIKCNSSYRRVPISGRCKKCGGKLLLTVHEASIKKYLELIYLIAERYKIDEYTVQRIKLVNNSLKSMFSPENGKQLKLL